MANRRRLGSELTPFAVVRIPNIVGLTTLLITSFRIGPRLVLTEDNRAKSTRAEGTADEMAGGREATRSERTA